MKNVKFRQARLEDIEAIQKVEKEYYEGFYVDQEVLRNWIEKLPENFLVAENENGEVVGFIFFEYIAEIKALPFIHELAETERGENKYFYISEIGVLDKYGAELARELYHQAKEKAKKDGIFSAVWLTGEKHKHDQVERAVVESEGFEKKERVENWEYLPNKFTLDHWLWAAS